MGGCRLAAGVAWLLAISRIGQLDSGRIDPGVAWLLAIDSGAAWLLAIDSGAAWLLAIDSGDARGSTPDGRGGSGALRSIPHRNPAGWIESRVRETRGWIWCWAEAIWTIDSKSELFPTSGRGIFVHFAVFRVVGKCPDVLY